MKTLLTALAAILLTITAHAEWVNHPGLNTSYFVSAGPMTLAEAKAFAEDNNAEVWAPRSIQEHDWVRAQFGRTELFWLGLEEFYGTWAYPDGTALSFSYFSSFTAVPQFGHGVVINAPNSRGFTRGFYMQVPQSQSFRVILRRTQPAQ